MKKTSTPKPGKKGATPDKDNPEWTEEMFAKARPAPEVLAELFGPTATQKRKKRRDK